MKTRKLEIGDLLQLSPEHPKFPGQFVVVEEPKEWGCQGIVYMCQNFPCVRFLDRAYIRCLWEDMEYIGKSEWFLKDKEADDDNDQNYITISSSSVD